MTMWNPTSGGPPSKILAIQLRRIGDSVLLAPALDGLREGWPEARIHLLTAQPVPDLFVGDSRVDVTWIRSARARLPQLSSDLRRENYDLVLDFQSLPLTAVLARATGAYSIGFKKRIRSFLYDRAVSLEDHRGSEYAADHKLDLLRAAGLNPTLSMPRLAGMWPGSDPWNDLPRGPRIALVPVSPWEHKRWSAAAFAETARILHRETGSVFVVAGGPGEAGQLREVAGELSDVPHRIKEFTTLREFGGFLGECHLFLGNDNGPRHVALALGTPTLAWFGHHNPTNWTPPETDCHPVLWDRSNAKGRFVREDLEIVPDQPEEAARVAARLLDLAASNPR